MHGKEAVSRPEGPSAGFLESGEWGSWGGAAPPPPAMRSGERCKKC